jgi:hypothetical protein
VPESNPSLALQLTDVHRKKKKKEGSDSDDRSGITTTLLHQTKFARPLLTHPWKHGLLHTWHRMLTHACSLDGEGFGNWDSHRSS